MSDSFNIYGPKKEKPEPPGRYVVFNFCVETGTMRASKWLDTQREAELRVEELNRRSGAGPNNVNGFTTVQIWERVKGMFSE